MKKCTRCKQDFKTTEFKIVNQKTGKRSALCPECKREYDREYWAKTKYFRNERKKINTKRILERNREYIIAYLKLHPCIDCKEKDIEVLEFDHQRDKLFNVAEFRGHSIENLQKEIDKCVVVCANCHRRRTNKQFKLYRYGR